MKETIIGLSLITSSLLYGGFDFGGSSGGCEGGSGDFQQQINHYNGDYENAIKVGTIPKDLKDIYISLKSNKDVDIRLYDINGKKIVHWPTGLLSEATKKSTTYNGVTIEYSGYNGDGTGLGHEYIKISGITKNDFIMKAFGYKAGYAKVDYKWAGKANCNDSSTPSASGSGDFQQQILQKDIIKVGNIPPKVNNLYITLKSDKDVDIQLYDKDNGKKIIVWPDGLLNGATKQSTTYEGMKIEWSGYNGDGTGLGNEYIKITGKTTRNLTMKAYGYKAGYAKVHYEWGNGPVIPPTNIEKLQLNHRDETKYIHKKRCSFTDVATNAWYYDYVTSLCQAAILQGYPDTGYSKYKPERNANWAEVTKVAQLSADYDKARNTCNENKYLYNEWHKCYTDMASHIGFTLLAGSEVQRGVALKYFAKLFWNKNFNSFSSAGNFLKGKGVIHGEGGNGIIDSTYLNKFLNRAELAKIALKSSGISKKELSSSNKTRELPYALIRENPEREVKRNLNTNPSSSNLSELFDKKRIMPKSSTPKRIAPNVSNTEYTQRVIENAEKTVGTRGAFVDNKYTSDVTHVRTVYGNDVKYKSANELCDDYDNKGLLQSGVPTEKGSLICYEKNTEGTAGDGHVAILREQNGNKEIGVTRVNEPVSIRTIDTKNIRGSIRATDFRDKFTPPVIVNKEIFETAFSGYGQRFNGNSSKSSFVSYETTYNINVSGTINRLKIGLDGGNSVLHLNPWIKVKHNGNKINISPNNLSYSDLLPGGKQYIKLDSILNIKSGDTLTINLRVGSFVGDESHHWDILETDTIIKGVSSMSSRFSTSSTIPDTDRPVGKGLSILAEMKSN